MDTVASVSGEALNVTSQADTVMIDEAQVIDPNMLASNGMIHVVDKVLMPSGDESTAMDEGTMMEDDQVNIVEAMVKDGRFDTLVESLQATGLAETLQSDGPFTLFAPTDAAFDQLGDRLPDLLQDTDTLSELLQYHVISGTKLTTTDFLDSAGVDTMAGQQVDIAIGDEAIRLNGDAEVVDADIETANGIIHVIDGVLFPPE